MSNRSYSDQMALITLTLLAESDQPVGARRLSEVFRSNGVDVAEATAGRCLSELDELGWTRSRGKKGRTLTEAGRRHLVELRLRDRLSEAGSLIAAAGELTRSEDIVDLLYARRAVEPEAARLAASRATCEELDQIDAAAEGCACSEGVHMIRFSRSFHRLLTQACHHRMLSAVAELLLETNERPNDRFELHRRSTAVGAYTQLKQDHRDIVAALKRRDAAEAERLTREHIDRMISVARKTQASSPLASFTGIASAC